jgi:hypothetical protein
MANFGIPSSGGQAPSVRNLPGNQGLFSVPLNVQRLFEHSIYSTAKFAAAGALGQTMRFFTVAQGNAGQGFTSQLTVSETNMLVGAQAPGGESYEITAISVEIYGASAIAPLTNDVRLFQRVAVLFWEFGPTLIMPISPISMIGSGGGIFGFTGDTGTPTTAANNGNGGLWLYNQVAVSIPSTQSFAIQMQFGQAGTGANLAPTNESNLRVSLFNFARNAVPIA